MSGMGELHLGPAVAAALESFGYSAGDLIVRDQAPTAARGHNMALAWPPSARYAAPALAGLISAVEESGRRALILAPNHALREWAAVLLPLTDAADLPTLVAEQPGRATRRLRDGQLRILLTSPETALALLERSALKAGELGHVVLVWPELFESEEALASLMPEVPAEAQRILVLADPKPGHPLLERYARRAHYTGPVASPAAGGVAAGPTVRVAHTAISQRAAALASLVESEDPATLTIWCADGRSAAEARAALPTMDGSVQVTTGDAPASALVIAWDLPTPERMTQLKAAGDLVLLVPPQGGAYVAAVTSRQMLVRLRGAAEDARDRAGQRRAGVEAAIRQGGLDGEILTLAPLFERHDPAQVAAALYRLWQSAPVAAAPAAATDAGTARREIASVGKIWLGVGKKDGAGPNDIMAALTREAGVDAASIGRIEIREMFSLVEVPAAEAEEIARKIAGRTIRRRTVNARVDRPGGGERPGGRGAAPRTRRPTR